MHFKEIHIFARERYPGGDRRMVKLVFALCQDDGNRESGINACKRARVYASSGRTDEPHAKHHQAIQRGVKRFTGEDGIYRDASQNGIK